MTGPDNADKAGENLSQRPHAARCGQRVVAVPRTFDVCYPEGDDEEDADQV